ncbi:hypothetical protein [Microbacterium sp. 10M-3C3]|jgi:hypothetical protein|uniref:hypothetical protein n=1 Tax=Microbacterium sp. 10M-3C3 TaxID=2483401 RepID=UPI001F0BF67B|nr:hypothetical protein [Microbacterium sp. 10M-3C3]
MGAMDELIDPGVVTQLRDALRSAAPSLELPSLAAAARGVPGRRLRDRVDLVREALLADIPAGWAVAERIVDDVLGTPRFAGWMIWPVTEFVATRAIGSGSRAKGRAPTCRGRSACRGW